MRNISLPTSLPIDPHLPAIAASLRTHSRLVLQATPGSGKTTRVAPYLLDHLIDDKKEIWVLEPRRLAARMAAMRVAFERGEKVGEEVGYQFRWEKAIGPRTRLRFLTEGTLVRMLLREPTLPKVAVVILDEFHERHLQGDEALALLLELQRTTRPDLKIVLMSATLEADYFQKQLECPVTVVEGRLFEIDIRYQIPPADARIEQVVARAIRDEWRAHGQDCGDFLVFLPGLGDILRTQEVLAPMMAQSGGFVCTLHGEMEADLQRKAIEPGGGRKVILSTNIAESSVTIEGIRVVIDTGLHRVYSEDPATGMPSLRTQKTSKSSCIQRANRAGRIGPGRAIRLFSESDFYGRPDADIPEILRTDLANTLLEIRALGFDEKKLAWPSPVPIDRWQASAEFLDKLGALDARGRLTDVGGRMSELPLSPRLSRFLMQAEQEGVIDPAVEIAVLLSEGKIPGVDLLELAQQGRAPARTRDRLRGFFDKRSAPLPTDAHDRLARCLLLAFPDRVAQRRRPFGKQQETFILSESGSATMPCHPVLGDKEFFVIPAMQKSETQRGPATLAKVLAICPVEAEWLLDVPGGAIKSTDDYSWDEKTKRLTYRSELRYGALTLESQAKPAQADLSTSEAFAVLALGIPRADLPALSVQAWLERIRARTDVTEAEQACTRIALWLKHHPAKQTHEFWTERFLEAMVGVTHLDHLRELDWTRLFPPGSFDDIQRFCPATLQLGKRRAKIYYSFDKDPWVESRLQDFFGVKHSPAVGGGKVPLTMHLLAPNQRAVQVTRDLVSFWKNTYPDLRKQLSRRYPRHKWPEDPSKEE